MAKKKVAPKSDSTSESSPSIQSESSAPSTVQGPIYVDGNMCFSPLDLARYELAQAKVINNLQLLKLGAARVDELKRQFQDNMAVLNREQAEVNVFQRKLEADLLSMQTELASKYGINLQRITYDDVTGRITQHDIPENPTEVG